MVKVLRDFAPAILVGLACLLFQSLGALDLLRFDRLEITRGAWWRILSGNFVHLGWSHLALNLLGLGLVQVIFADRFSPLPWITTTALSCLAVGFGLYWLNPELSWYVGLSGCLHGLFAAGAASELKRAPRGAAVMLLVLCAKLIWEQTMGALPGTREAAGGNVIVDAHLYGAIAGLGVGLLHALQDTRLNTKA
jgi:rhomboid family GlyGly-CTERM serine protease